MGRKPARRGSVPARAALACAALALAGAARAADATDDASDDAERLDTILVTAPRETHQVQRVTPDDAQARPQGTSPLKVLEKLPGVHFQSADAWGNYEWSTRISVRGFNQTRLGFTLDGIPLGDMAYGNHNGLHVSRALIAENFGLVEVAQGIGALGTPSTSNLGGTLAIHSDDPSAVASVRAAASAGSDAARRSYARLDSGDRGGFAAYASAMWSDVGRYKGDGDQQHGQFNAKAVYDDGDRLHVDALASLSRRDEVDYVDFSLDSRRRLGWDWDNYSPDWARAVAAARDVFTGGVTTRDDAYFRGRGLRNDDLAGLGVEWAATSTLAVRARGYYHRNEGQGHWFTPYQPSSPDVPIALRATEYDIERSGVTAAVAWTLGVHTLEAGLWLEDSVHGLQRNFYYIDGPVFDGRFFGDPDQRLFHQGFDTRTRQLYAQDTLELLDGRWTVDFGVKRPRTRIVAQRFVGPRAGGRLVAESSGLPQAGTSFRFGDGEELFASYARNLAAFQAGVDGPFSARQEAFDAAAGTLRPERSRTLEAGWRRVRPAYEAALALYAVRFDSRLLSIAQCQAIVGCANAFANVGSVHTRGAELTLVWKPDERLRWFNAVSYNRARYDDDYVDGTRTVATAGKTVVDSPRLLVATELAWRDGPWDVRIDGKYTGRRYVSFVNDSSVAGYWVLNASAAYELPPLRGLARARVQLALTNLADKRYFATVGTTGFAVSDPLGQNYTLLRGAPRQVFVGVELEW
jgi:iron complex outermembrane receptor protein